MSRTRRWLPIVFLALCALAPLWKAVFQGEVIGPFDQIRHMAPWNGPAPDRPWDVLQADAVLQIYPWRDMVFDAWGKGQLPAWNPYELGGTPLLANSQSAALYPPHILVGLLRIPTSLAMTLLAWFHLFLAGFGVYYLTRRLGGGRTGSATAGAAFALSPFMLSWTPLASVITTVSWIPWILGFIVAIFYNSSSILRVRSTSLQAWLAFSTGMMLLGGHLQFCAYGIGSAVILTIWLFFSKRRSKESDKVAVEGRSPEEDDPNSFGNSGRWSIFTSPLRVTIALIAGLLIASPQILPVLSYGHFSHRANTPSAQGYSDYVKRAIPDAALQSLAFPTAVGNPAKPSPQIKDVNDYWPQLTSLGMDFAESAIGLGPLVFLLLLFTRKLRDGSAAIAFIGALALLAGLGTIVDWPLYFLVPGWSATGSPGRASVLFVLSACVLAGLAVRRLGSQKPKPLGLTLVLGGLGGLILALAPIIFGIAYSSPLANSDQVSAAIRTSVVDEFPVFAKTLLIALGTIAAVRFRTGYRWAIPVGAALIAFVAYGWNLIPTSASTLPAVRTDPSLRYAFINASLGLWSPNRAVMPPDTAASNRTREIGGYDSLLHRDSVDMLRAIDGEDPASPTNGNMMFVKPKADPKLLSEAGVTRVWSLRPLPGFGSAIENAGVYVYQLPGPGRIYGPGPIKIEEETYDHLKLNAIGPGALVDKDRFMPGWTAMIDGKSTNITALDSPLGKGLWRQVTLPAGSHEVEFKYTPPGFSTGMLGAILGTAFCAWGWIVAWRRRS